MYTRRKFGVVVLANCWVTVLKEMKRRMKRSSSLKSGFNAGRFSFHVPSELLTNVVVERSELKYNRNSTVRVNHFEIYSFLRILTY